MNYWMALIFAALLTGCSAFPAQQAEQSHRYLLDAKLAGNASQHKSDVPIAVSLPVAWPGFDTPQMAYLKKPLELEYFANHRWVDTPAHMIKPLLVQALEQRFAAVSSTPGTLKAQLRLDTELVRLQQDFTGNPSRIELSLKVRLIEVKSQRLLAERQFDETEIAASDDPYGGALAANRALQRALERIAEFCSNAGK